MKKHLIHRNLNTSFVDLPALVAHLKSLQFVGSIHVELSSYEATIVFTGGGSLQAREFDHATGRIAEGENALVRILRRAGEPGGLIHVYQAAPETTHFEWDGVYVDETIAAFARRNAAGKLDSPGNCPDLNAVRFKPVIPTEYSGGNGRSSASPMAELPHLPFALRGMHAADLSQAGRSRWLDLLTLTAELLRLIDDSLGRGGLDFSEAFRDACRLAASEHPFMDPDVGTFSYKNGQIGFRTELAGEPFADGVAAALAHVFEKISSEPEMRKAYHFTRHRIRLLIEKRKGEFDRFAMTRRLEPILGRMPD